MKSLIIIIFLVIYSNLFSQNPGWNSIVTTDIPNKNNGENDEERIALFANHYGIHVLSTQYTSDSMHVTYYRLQTSGDLDSALTFSLDDYGDFPNIVGDENTLYAVYRKNDTIKVKRSFNGGTSWSSVTSRTFDNGDVNCNAVDAAYNSSKGLHVVWSEKVIVEDDSHYESFFNRFTGLAWVGLNVSITDHATVDSAGGFPTVTTSSVSGTDRAHVTINTGTADLLGDNYGKSYSRDFNYITWSAPVVIVPTDSSKMDRLLVTNDGYIHSFYYKRAGLPPFRNLRKLVTSSTWADENTVDSSVVWTSNTHKIPITKTSGDTLHAFFFEAGLGYRHTKKHSTANSWLDTTDVSSGGVSWQDAAVTSSSNDVFTLFVNGLGAGSQTNYKYRQYDDIPLPPQNLTVDRSGNNHPLLEWDENYEPDLDKYYIYRYDTYGGGWQYLNQTSNEEYEDTTLTYCTARPPAECENERNFYYRITAIDLQSHESEPSDSVIALLVGGAPDKKSANNSDITPVEYSLQQNYPNPFNPSTLITYSLAKDAFVTLRVYDILGNKIVKLVNASQTAGVHEINFDASKLSSGIYIYRLTAMNGERILFSESKQMLMIK